MWNSDNHLLSYCVGIQDKGSVLQSFKSFLVRKKKYAVTVCQGTEEKHQKIKNRN